MANVHRLSCIHFPVTWPGDRPRPHGRRCPIAPWPGSSIFPPRPPAATASISPAPWRPSAAIRAGPRQGHGRAVPLPPPLPWPSPPAGGRGRKRPRQRVERGQRNRLEACATKNKLWWAVPTLHGCGPRLCSARRTALTRNILKIKRLATPTPPRQSGPAAAQIADQIISVKRGVLPTVLSSPIKWT